MAAVGQEDSSRKVDTATGWTEGRSRPWEGMSLAGLGRKARGPAGSGMVRRTSWAVAQEDSLREEGGRARTTRVQEAGQVAGREGPTKVGRHRMWAAGREGLTELGRHRMRAADREGQEGRKD